MRLSIIIVNWNTREDLQRCLRSLPAALGDLAHEVFVVDNASCDGSPEMVERDFPRVILIRNPENTGFAHANNQAIPRAAGDYVLLLNSDTVAHSGSLATLVAAMDAEPRVGIAGAKLLNADGSLQYSCRRFPTFLAGLFRNSAFGRLFCRNRQVCDYLMTDFDHNSDAEVDWVSGAALCIRRETFTQIGPLDERYFMYCEDVDWCYTARLAGWLVKYYPAAQITHLIGRSSDLAVARMVRAHHHSMTLFYWKHYAAATPWLMRWVPPVGIWLRLHSVLWAKRREARARLRQSPACESEQAAV